MMFCFCDTSVLLKKYLEEMGSEKTLKILSEAECIFVSSLTELELISAIERAKRLHRILSPEYREAMARMESDLSKSHLSSLNINPEVVRLAKRLIRQHRLLPADAIQLATALSVFKEFDDDEISFLCSDQVLLEAARLEGLRCIDPAK